MPFGRIVVYSIVLMNLYGGTIGGRSLVPGPLRLVRQGCMELALDQVGALGVGMR